ncbi:ependymin-related protein 2-like [Patella vulgata]|uniref:ependymin-related protein 2-like n=1 Tax=Patella vulgata TaxID=6465 RepID=UPI0024A8870E|nr:ependymin-related protein 2-like [Patella vulgata]
MFSLYFILCVLGVAFCADPPKCCMDKQFQATLGESGSFYRAGSDDFEPLDGYNFLTYDFYGLRLAIESHSADGNGTTETARIIEDYVSRKQFFIANGSCIVNDLTSTIRQPCITPESIFQGEFKLGFGFTEIDVHVWKHTNPNGSSTKFTVAKDTCVPLIETSYAIDDQGTKTETVYVYHNFTPGLKNVDVFQIPSYCSIGGGQVAGLIG